MIAQALRRSLIAPQSASRVTGQYGTGGGSLYTVTWDASLSRLTFNLTASGVLRTAVSSQAQAAVQNGSNISVYNVTSSGLATPPVATYAYPPFYTGYNTVGVNANGDALYVGTGGSTAGRFQFYNLATNVRSAVIVAQSVSTETTTYDTGDGWVTQVVPANGVRTDQPPFELLSAPTRLRINYQVNSAGASPLASVSTSGITTLPLSGLPRILDQANTVYAVKFNLGVANNAFCRQGAVLIPCTLEVDEIDIQPGDNGTAIVNRANSQWYGVIQATMTGCSFIPLSTYYGYRTGTICAVSGNVYTPLNGQSLAFGYVGTQSLTMEALLPGIGVLWRRPPSNSGQGSLSGYVKSVTLRDGTTVTETANPVPSVNLLTIPHLGAIVAWGDNTGVTAYNDRGIVQISFDAGKTWQNAVTWASAFAGQTPTRRNPNLSDFRSAVPLFIV